MTKMQYQKWQNGKIILYFAILHFTILHFIGQIH